MTKATLLQKVRNKLAPMKRSELFEWASRSGVGPDTVMRIRAGGEYDPGFSKVQKLADALGVKP